MWRKVKSSWDKWNARSLAEEPIMRLSAPTPDDFEVDHLGDYATLNSYQSRDGTVFMRILD